THGSAGAPGDTGRPHSSRAVLATSRFLVNARTLERLLSAPPVPHAATCLARTTAPPTPTSVHDAASCSWSGQRTSRSVGGTGRHAKVHWLDRGRAWLDPVLALVHRVARNARSG